MHSSEIDHQKSVVKNLKAENRRLTLMNSQLGKRVARLEDQLIDFNGNLEADDCNKKTSTPLKRKRAETGVSYDTHQEEEEETKGVEVPQEI